MARGGTLRAVRRALSQSGSATVPPGCAECGATMTYGNCAHCKGRTCPDCHKWSCPVVKVIATGCLGCGTPDPVNMRIIGDNVVCDACDSDTA